MRKKKSLPKNEKRLEFRIKKQSDYSLMEIS